MYRMLTVFLFLVASTAASSAQGLFGFLPSVWQGEQGSYLKILRFDTGTGNFTGVFISPPTGRCPGVPYDLVGRFRGDRVVFRTSRTWTTDCNVTTVWTGRVVNSTTVATKAVATYVAPDGEVVRARGTSVFNRL